MKLYPEVILIGDHTRSCLTWTLDQETKRIEALAEEHPEMAEAMAKNGWTARAVAWGHIISGFLDQPDYGSYEDLRERCEKAARKLEHQAALEPVEVMAARLRGKAQGVRLAVSFLAEAHQSGRPDFAFDLHQADEIERRR